MTQMTAGVQVMDHTGNFWKLNPHFLVPDSFKEFYSKDKSKDKSASSMIMWALAYYTDSKSPYKQLSDTDRKNLIQNDLLKNPKFKFEEYNEFLKKWELFKSPIQKLLDQWDRLMNEKNDYINSLKYNKDNSKEIETLLLSNVPLMEAYEKITSKLKEEDQGVVKGGEEESLVEKGII